MSKPASFRTADHAPDTGAGADHFDSLRSLLRRAKVLFALLLAVTMALLLWHQFGMTKIVELNAPSIALKVEDDRSAGGASVATLARQGKDIEFACNISTKSQWPYCKLLFEFAPLGQGVDLSGFDSIVVEASTAGQPSANLGFVIVNIEAGFTRADLWSTYKINQVDGLEIASGKPYLIPLRWFTVPQWWKEMAKPPVRYSFVNIDNATRLEVLTSGGPEGKRVIEVRSIRLVGKLVNRSVLLGAIAAAWIVFAIGCLAVANATLRARLRASSRKVALLAQVNKALELEAKELAGQAYTDPLTGALNRQGLRAELMSTSTLLAAPMSVIFADIDHFKHINDCHGHDTGDEVLRRFAGLIGSSIRSSDRLVRWGGEEFLIVCPLTDVRQAAQLGEQLRAALHLQSWPAGLRVTASFGIAQHRADSEINTVIKEADEQLYRAKGQGRDRVCAAYV